MRGLMQEMSHVSVVPKGTQRKTKHRNVLVGLCLTGPEVIRRLFRAKTGSIPVQ